MSQFHRNFEWANPPRDGTRPGSYISPNAFQVDGVTPNTPILIGQPVTVDTTQAVDSVYGLQPVKIAAEASAPVKGLSGIAIYEFKNDEAFAGFDQNLTGFSDLAFIPPAQALQVNAGGYTEARFRNTSALTFLNTRPYAARTMVAGLGGATNTVVVGTLLTPGVGTDAAGYWEVTATASLAWLVVTSFNLSTGECVARCLF